MRKSKLILISVMFFYLTACQESPHVELVDTSKVLATVGDYQVTAQYLKIYLKSQGLDEPNPQQTKRAMDEVIKQLSLSHQAKNSGLQLSLEQSLLIEQARHRALAQVAVEHYLQEKPVTEEAIRAEYKRVTAELKGQEYYVHHMLFQDEVAALGALAQVEAGETYLNVEQQYLSQLQTPKNVGDIGWVNIMQVPEVFRGPLQLMQVGEVHTNTLQSQFGVHVLYLADKRALVPPTYESVKAGIKQSLEKEKIDRYQQLSVIKSKAKVVQ